MAYIINRYNTTPLTVVEDGTIDQTTDLKLVGKNYAGYGEIQNENFVFLLENFASKNEPPKALMGQIWFDSGTFKLKFYDGFNWRTTGGSEVAETQPEGLTEGDFWWDSVNRQLYAYDGETFVLIGPQGVGDDVTQFQSRTIRDTTNVNRPVIVSIVSNEILHIISSVDFTIHPDIIADYPGFDAIHKGLTLKNTMNGNGGQTTTTHRWWGTATNSDRLGGYLASDFIRFADASFSSAVSFPDSGIIIGDDADLKLRVVNGNQAIIGNEVGYDLFFQVKESSTNNVVMPIRLTGDSLLPGYDFTTGIPLGQLSFGLPTTSKSVNIGSSTFKFNNMYATNFVGTATVATSVSLSTAPTGLATATNEAVAHSICARDASGDIRANLFVGKATSAYFADLAEMYVADEDYEPGTVVSIGGTAEITQSKTYCDTKVAGVVSTNPAYLMNKDCKGIAVALKGRVPCKVVGKVKKGNFLVTSHVPGVAVAVEEMVAVPHASCIIGKSLHDSNEEEIKLIEIMV